MMIVSANLETKARKIYLKINKLRKKGWFRQDKSAMLIKKYADEKDVMVEILNEKQKERNKLDNEIRSLAKKVNHIK